MACVAFSPSRWKTVSACSFSSGWIRARTVAVFFMKSPLAFVENVAQMGNVFQARCLSFASDRAAIPYMLDGAIMQLLLYAGTTPPLSTQSAFSRHEPRGSSVTRNLDLETDTKMKSHYQAFVLGTLSLLAVLVAGAATADSIHGRCYNKAGEPCDYKIHRISTSWNSKKAFPADGRYELDFGGSVGSRITVYCDGDNVGGVRVSGSTRFDVRCR